MILKWLMSDKLLPSIERANDLLEQAKAEFTALEVAIQQDRLALEAALEQVNLDQNYVDEQLQKLK